VADEVEAWLGGTLTFSGEAVLVMNEATLSLLVSSALHHTTVEGLEKRLSELHASSSLELAQTKERLEKQLADLHASSSLTLADFQAESSREIATLETALAASERWGLGLQGCLASLQAETKRCSAAILQEMAAAKVLPPSLPHSLTPSLPSPLHPSLPPELSDIQVYEP